MENRYLYRGKRVDNGEWVEGHLITDEKDDLKYFIGYVLGTDEDGSPHDLDAVQVDPSTICQCTGLKDKNGTLIWENDIIENDKGNLYKAFWQDDHYQFSWVCVKSEKLPIGAKWNFECFRGYEMEVIGNIFDNPELFGVNCFHFGNS